MKIKVTKQLEEINDQPPSTDLNNSWCYEMIITPKNTTQGYVRSNAYALILDKLRYPLSYLRNIL